MHSYRDAIRRTAGAYVLYPGTESKNKSGFHEILPGLGAFAISPSKSSAGTSDLKKFLYDVIDHFLNRASQREKMSYRTFEIHQDKNPNEVREILPEAYGGNRNFSPDEITVLVGYYKSREHLIWSVKSGLYNARAETNRGSLRLGPSETNARYILLHTDDELQTGHLFRVIEKGPRVFSAKKLKEKEYPTEPSGDFYLVYTIEKSIEKELMSRKWDISQLNGFKSGRGSGFPFAVTLSELMRVVVK